MKKLLSILLLLSMLITFTACNKEAEQTTETTLHQCNTEDDVIIDYFLPWYSIEDEYQTFLEETKDFLPESYIPYTQLPYPEDIEYIAAWDWSGEWEFHYEYSNDLEITIYPGKRNYDLKEGVDLLLKPTNKRGWLYIAEKESCICVEDDVIYRFSNGSIKEIYWHSEYGYTFRVTHDKMFSFPQESAENVFIYFLLPEEYPDQDPIATFDKMIFGTPES